MDGPSTNTRIMEEVAAANSAARARNKEAVDAKYRAWLAAGGARAGDYAVGDRVWLAVPVANKLGNKWRGPLTILSRKDLTYRLGIPLCGVLPSAAHANRLRPYRDDGPESEPPPDEVDTSGVDWDSDFEPLLDRTRLVRNQRVNWRVLGILQRRQKRGRDRHGNTRVHWKVRCDDGMTRWTPTHNVDEDMIIGFNARGQTTPGPHEPDATAASVGHYCAQAW